MKQIILTLVFVLTATAFCNAQKIEMEKGVVSQNGVKLTMAQLAQKMKSNKEAYGIIKKAQSNAFLSTYILGGVGGGLAGWPLGTATAGGKANWSLVGICIGLVIIAIPISLEADKNVKKAVDLYNNSLDSSVYKEFKPELNIISNGNGIGLAINF